jgi:hypothetical protein
MFSPVISDACGGQFLYQADVQCFATVFASCFSMLGQLYTFFSVLHLCTDTVRGCFHSNVTIRFRLLWTLRRFYVINDSSSIKLSANTCLTEALCILFITMSMFMVFHFQCQFEKKYFHQLSLLQLLSVYHHLYCFHKYHFVQLSLFRLLNNKKPMHRNHTIITGAAIGNAINI